jgi:hypothetical protein
MKTIGKSWFKSKTILVNLIIACIGIAEFLESRPAGATIMIIGILNIVLRFLTNKAVKLN